MSLEAENKLKVFISYAREDASFADELGAGLGLVGFLTMIDRAHAGDPDRHQSLVKHWISEADKIVFVLTPVSANSNTCKIEIEEAIRFGIPVIPVVAKPLEGVRPPDAVMNYNYIFFFGEQKALGSSFGSGLTQLVAALNTDSDWSSRRTRLLNSALEWDARGRQKSLLLSPDQAAAAKEWLAARPKNLPAPSDLQVQFIQASVASAAEQGIDEQRRLQQLEAAIAKAEDLRRKLQEKKPSKTGKVFISYRRQDAMAYAGWLFTLLTRGALRNRVFIDVDTIQKGEDFTKALEEHLAQCDVMLVLIGQNWLDARDSNDRRRLDDPDDFVRLEVKTALLRGVSVIPLLFDGAPMPKVERLPDDLKPLANRQNYTISYGTFARDVEGLQRHIIAQIRTPIAWRRIVGVFIIVALVGVVALHYLQLLAGSGR
jgi:hypothetical protein